MEIKVLGPGCHNCKELEKRTINALAEMDLAANVSKVTDLKEITKHVMSTPGLVIDGKVVSQGRVPTKDEIKRWVKAAQNL
jgi:small redox-active disulfide protein 2